MFSCGIIIYYASKRLYFRFYNSTFVLHQTTKGFPNHFSHDMIFVWMMINKDASVLVFSFGKFIHLRHYFLSLSEVVSFVSMLENEIMLVLLGCNTNSKCFNFLWKVHSLQVIWKQYCCIIRDGTVWICIQPYD